jgi:hypothetical protein
MNGSEMDKNAKNMYSPQTPRLVAFGHAYILLEDPKKIKNILLLHATTPKKKKTHVTIFNQG